MEKRPKFKSDENCLLSEINQQVAELASAFFVENDLENVNFLSILSNFHFFLLLIAYGVIELVDFLNPGGLTSSIRVQYRVCGF